MTKIRLQSITLKNFKKCRFLHLNLDGRDTDISGANGSGKTTIYKAYYWCLTGKTFEPNETVQTLNKFNEVIHKVETSVAVTLKIDDSYEVTIERRLHEDWKALGQPNEQLKGTKQLRFINDVPMSVAEFNNKLGLICDIEKLLMITDITRFMSMKVDDRRKILLGLVGDIDESEILSNYPSVQKAVTVERKSIAELKKQTLSTKKRANDELLTIPSQIDAQNRLIVSVDFDALRTQIQEIDRKIGDYDKLLQASSDELAQVKTYNDKIREKEKKISERKKLLWEEQRSKIDDARKNLLLVEKDFAKASQDYKKEEEEQSQRVSKKIQLMSSFEQKKAEWNRVNNESFNFQQAERCPICGHIFTDSEKEATLQEAIERYNQQKSELLESLQSEATAIHTQITALTGVINEYAQIIGPTHKNALNAREMAKNELYKHLTELESQDIGKDDELSELESQLSELKNNPPKTDRGSTDDINKQKSMLIEQRDSIVSELANEQVNYRIKEENKRLEKRSKECAQIVADCDNTLYQIQQYQKEKIGAIEKEVNYFFNLAHWKFFEKNVSNDDLQEVCVCLHDGVDYNSTNTADKINLKIDIAAGLSRAFNIEAPIFVDNKESVAEVYNVPNQLITLQHIKDAKFSINYL